MSYELNGWQYNGSGLGGVYGDIYNYSPWVQQGSVVAAWVMLANGGHYAQIGWLEDPNNDRFTFYQAVSTSGQIIENLTMSPYPIGSTQQYEVLYNNTPNEFSVFVNGTQLNAFPLGFVPNSAQNYAEVHNLKDQMPGTFGQFEVFSGVHVYQSGWRNFNGAPHDAQPSYWGNDAYSSTEDYVWDQRCSS
ncbi:MAG: hypothetical protein ACYDD0_00520 [Candidatus Dormibacteria bacterium]